MSKKVSKKDLTGIYNDIYSKAYDEAYKDAYARVSDAAYRNAKAAYRNAKRELLQERMQEIDDEARAIIREEIEYKVWNSVRREIRDKLGIEYSEESSLDYHSKIAYGEIDQEAFVRDWVQFQHSEHSESAGSNDFESATGGLAYRLANSLFRMMEEPVENGINITVSLQRMI